MDRWLGVRLLCSNPDLLRRRISHQAAYIQARCRASVKNGLFLGAN